MSPGLRSLLLEVLPGIFTPQEPGIRPIGGGSISETYLITGMPSGEPRCFCKVNDRTRFPGLFRKEADGLRLLGETGIFRVPRILACAESGDHQLLVLEYVDSGSRSPIFWRRFGEQLASLHRITSPAFGLDHPNYMGSLSQDNTPSASWPEFFEHRRLEPQVRMAAARGLLDRTAAKQFANLYRRLPDIFPPEPSALLHGDLWSGNFLTGTDGHPVLIDPAVYYGHRSIDLAMTTLFGGFDPAFYEAYHAHYPLPANCREQWAVANLYPLLIHLNLFGHSYLSNILHTIRGF
jgi:fructosamine-3-kinase